MSDLKTTSDPSAFAVGGMRGHIFRRVIHVGMSVLPYVYFHFGDDIAALAATTQVTPLLFHLPCWLTSYG